jgi:hypothetical protein
MRPPEILFSKHAAGSVDAAMDQLFELFPDHWPKLIAEEEENWKFALAWPENLTFVDSGVGRQALELYGLSGAALVPFTRAKRCGQADFVFSMFHSRALLAASLAMRRRGGAALPIIVHVDDHEDLFPSLVTRSGVSGEVRDVVFGETVEVGDPESIGAAIDRGVINKATFLTTYLLATPPGTLIYVNETLSERESRLVPVNLTLNIGGKDLDRAALEELRSGRSPGRQLVRRREFPVELPEIADGAVWLDVDMDAFCNRFDGDSDRKDHSATDGERSLLMGRVGRFVTGLQSASWLPRVEAVSEAVSPGFFPSEYWATAVPLILDGISKALCSAADRHKSAAPLGTQIYRNTVT